MQDLLRGKAGAALVHHSTVLRGNIAGKRVNAARNNAAAQDVGQVAHIMGQLAAEQHIHHTAVHAPPIVDGSTVGAGFIAGPAAIQHGAHHVFIELAPMPKRRSQIHQRAAGADAESSELSRRAERRGGIAPRDHRDALLLEGLDRVPRQAGPLQADLNARVDHPRAKGKRIDVGRNAKGGRIRHITHAVLPRHSGSNGAGDELCLIHAAVIGADRPSSSGCAHPGGATPRAAKPPPVLARL